MLSFLDFFFKPMEKAVFKTIEPATATAIGIAALLGGGAGAAMYFGGKKKKREELPTGGIQPYQSLMDFPMGADVSERIRQAMATGYGPEFEKRITSPVVAEREARFAETELPFAEAAMSARGLGRSTIAGREIGRISGQKERDINQVLAQAYLENRMAMERARGQGLQFAGQEVGARAGAAQFERAGQVFDIGQRDLTEAERTQNLLAGIGTGLTTGTQAYGAMQPTDTQQLLDYLKRGRPSPYTTGGLRGAKVGAGEYAQAPSINL